MADILDKIGKYFADQEAQMRELYVHAAATAATPSTPATHAKSAVPQPPPRAETATGKSRFGRVRQGNIESGVEAIPSLVRTRVSLSRQCEDTVDDSEALGSSLVSGGTASRESNGASMRSWRASSEDDASVEALSTQSTGACETSHKNKKLLKTRNKKKKKKPNDKDLEAERQRKQQQAAAEGFARAQERARRIQHDKATHDRQQQHEREASAARLAGEMRKIEVIRQRGKQFAMRLQRPQSAPSASTPIQRYLQEKDENGFASEGAVLVESTVKPTFLDALEHELYEQMMAEMVLTHAIHEKQSREQDEWSRLQAQIKKTTDRNAIKQERVHCLSKRRDELVKEISESQAEAVALRHERHQLEDKSKRERQLMQREAEREIHARLRREESQRLVDDERTSSDQAAGARAKAKLRVQSRAALLKRVLHGCDIRSSSRPSRNQEPDKEVPSKTTTAVAIEVAPELAEFEEEGLSGEVHEPLASPQKTSRLAVGQAINAIDEPTFTWQVPALTTAQIHTILHEAFDMLSDDD